MRWSVVVPYFNERDHLPAMLDSSADPARAKFLKRRWVLQPAQLQTIVGKMKKIVKPR
jgi:hypothetical protein